LRRCKAIGRKKERRKVLGDRGKITESDIEIISERKTYYDSESRGYEHLVELGLKVLMVQIECIIMMGIKTLLI
jgi:hypothetical protein